MANDKNDRLSVYGGMKWHKFLIYFNLWASFITNTLTGTVALFAFFSGNYDSDSPYIVWAIFYTITQILTGIYALFVCFRLARFKKNAPKHLIIFLSIFCIMQSLSCIIDSTSPIAYVLGGIVYILLNNNYYSKRSGLFIN